MFRSFASLLVLAACLSADERKTAEWVIRQGGRVLVAGQAEPIGHVTALPAQGGIWLEGVDLYGTIIEPKELENLSGLTKIKELFLPGPSWNPGAGSKLDANEELKFLAPLTTLEKLHFSLHFLTNVNVQDKGLKHLEGLRNLRELRLAQGRIRNFSLAAFPLLEGVDLSYSTATDEVLKSLAGHKHLKRLQLRDSLVTDAGLEYLRDISTLEEIDLYGLKISDAGLRHLQGLRALRKLNLSGGPITDTGAEVLAGMSRLRELNLYRAELTNAGLARLAALRELESLDLRYSRVTAAGVEKLRAALPKTRVEFSGGARGSKTKAGLPAKLDPKVRTLSLARSSVSDADMRALAALRGLEELDLEGTEIGDLGLAELRGLTGLKKLRLGSTTVSDRGLASLSAMTALTELSLSGSLVRDLGDLPASLETLDLSNTKVTSAALERVAALPRLKRLNLAYTDAKLPVLPRVQALDLTGTDVDDAALETVARMTELRELLLNHGRFTEKGFALLGSLLNLERLEAVRTRLEDGAGETFQKLSRLRRLNLDYTKAGDKTMRALAELPLEELQLDSTNVTDAAAEVLARMTKLKRLNLYHTTVGEAVYEKLRAALSATKIVWDRDSKLPNRRGS
jgi:Leucine-rich repeat (LRR) protein